MNLPCFENQYSEAYADIDGGSGYDTECFDHWEEPDLCNYTAPPGIEESRVFLAYCREIRGNELSNRLYLSCDSMPNGTHIELGGGNDYFELDCYGDYYEGPTWRPVSIGGGAGNDTILGTRACDMINGGDGNDLIDGGKRNDTLEGGAGNDTLVGGSGRDRLFGGSGNDLLKAKDGEKDTLNGDSGSDTAQRDASLDLLTSVERKV